MSFLVQCQACGEKVAPSPEGCPKCGAKHYGLEAHHGEDAECVVSELTAPRDFPLVKTSTKT